LRNSTQQDKTVVLPIPPGIFDLVHKTRQLTHQSDLLVWRHRCKTTPVCTNPSSSKGERRHRSTNRLGTHYSLTPPLHGSQSSTSLLGSDEQLQSMCCSDKSSQLGKGSRRSLRFLQHNNTHPGTTGMLKRL
jgi:hypothetical protein